MSVLVVKKNEYGFTAFTYTPMECLNIDFIGPFSDKGYTLVIVCTFTRWKERYGTADATALSTTTFWSLRRSTSVKIG